MPGYFNNTMAYTEKLEKNKEMLSNFIKVKFWEKKTFQNDNRIVLSLLFYEDDFKTNKPLGTSSDSLEIHFSLAGVIGDNSAVNKILGFQTSFSSNYPFQFCLVNSNDINSTFNISDWKIQNKKDVTESSSEFTDVAGQFVVDNIKSASTIELLTVDAMHDILEGVADYDSSLILHEYLIKRKYFNIDQLNKRINGLFYGFDEKRNMLCKFNCNKINNKHLQMSASESQCFLLNIGVLIGDFISFEDPY